MAHGCTWAAASVGKRVVRSAWSGGDAMLAVWSASSSRAHARHAESHWPGGPYYSLRASPNPESDFFSIFFKPSRVVKCKRKPY
jgi:hypothetical protein